MAPEVPPVPPFLWLFLGKHMAAWQQGSQDQDCSVTQPGWGVRGFLGHGRPPTQGHRRAPPLAQWALVPLEVWGVTVPWESHRGLPAHLPADPDLPGCRLGTAAGSSRPV